MRILVCAHDSNITGGANRSLLMIIDGLIKKGCYIEALIPQNKGQLKEELDKRGIKTHSCMYFGVTSSIRGDGQDWKRIAKVYLGYPLECFQALRMSKTFKKSGFDLVYTNTRGPVVGAKTARRLHIPHIVHVREFGAEKPLFGFWGYKKMYRYSEKIILISKALFDEYSKHVNTDKLIEIPNGIESPLGLPLAHRKDDNEFKMLLTGRLVPDKGQIEAIEALKILHDKGYKNIRLYFAGSLVPKMRMDWYERDLKELVSKYGLDSAVVFLGEVGDMVSLRETMDIELMCAIKETFGRVTVEAMRSGLAVVGSNTGGTLEIIQNNKTGLLYQQGDPTDLAEKILMLYNNRELREQIANNAYQYSQTSFTPEKNIEAVYDVVNEVVKHNG